VSPHEQGYRDFTLKGLTARCPRVTAATAATASAAMPDQLWLLARHSILVRRAERALTDGEAGEAKARAALDEAATVSRQIKTSRRTGR
jgi:hypothetical protein